ncbi:ABC transporter permease [Chlorobaculum sp. 24CR]|uniref:ABC transporter permease n=1 Tax=Chlorobaculum sp. 24CR TaxID=2508878 RepID=UPI00100C0EA7|nr:FtsX-like permease family protein [Chlorobaculum sp. 24CR]RXK84114.1 ABC transporter permease [Chlorobaculum sp. 24CR]
MKAEFYIARRFAFKPRSLSKPTFIVLTAVVGIAVGTAALILTLSIVNGFASVIEGKLISFSSHLQVRQPDERIFLETRRDLQTLKSVPGVATVSPFLEMNVMLRSRAGSGDAGGNIVPAMIQGIDPRVSSRFLQNGPALLEAASASAESPLPILVGKTLARKLGVKAGDRLMIVGIAAKNGASAITGSESVIELLSSLDLHVARVAGIYDTGLTEGFDDIVAFADLARLQRIYHPGMISGYEANVSDLSDLQSISANAAARLGYPFYTYTVYERYANLFEWLKLQQNIMPLLIITITIVAVFNIVSTLLVLIIEKTREIGMLSALGLEPRAVSMVFMGQAFMISLVGIGLGNLLALGLSLFELRFHLITLPEKSYFIRHVPLEIDPLQYLAVSAGVAALTLLFAFIPSRVAASLRPSTALTT